MEFLEEFNKKFKYQYDRDQYGSRDAWYVMNHEPYNGDC
jgi:predicted transglutaminase-like cysteine proteinase